MNTRNRAIKKIQETLIQNYIKKKEKAKNQKYGEFIIQTNKVQYLLKLFILLRALFPEISVKYFKELDRDLERLELGQLIGYFRICVKDISEMEIESKLTKYNCARNKLAHKIYTTKKLSEEDLKNSIKIGGEIIIFLNNEIGKFKKVQ